MDFTPVEPRIEEVIHSNMVNLENFELKDKKEPDTKTIQKDEKISNNIEETKHNQKEMDDYDDFFDDFFFEE